MIDTHAHLFLEDFDADRSAVLERAFAAGVSDIYMPNIDCSSLERLFAAPHPHVHAAIGLHPTSVRADYAEELSKLHDVLLAAYPAAAPIPNTSTNSSLLTTLSPLPIPLLRPIAIGEIGLDYYWDATHRTEQLHAFETQIKWAQHFALPVMIHSRDKDGSALPDICRILDHYPSSRGIFHCFGGTHEEAEKLLSYSDFYLGIGGVVTYKNSTLSQVLRDTVPLERIVLETDSPYLSPVPHRGRRNEPAHLAHIAAKLAEIYGVSIATIDQQTTTNALRLR